MVRFCVDCGTEVAGDSKRCESCTDTRTPLGIPGNSSSRNLLAGVLLGVITAVGWIHGLVIGIWTVPDLLGGRRCWGPSVVEYLVDLLGLYVVLVALGVYGIGHALTEPTQSEFVRTLLPDFTDPGAIGLEMLVFYLASGGEPVPLVHFVGSALTIVTGALLLLPERTGR